jgi:choline dehydrogenase
VDIAEYDFVVVGAGVAGSVVASRLSENPDWRVLLIEAGPEEPTATAVPAFAVSAVGSELDWRYQTQPEGTACLSTGGVCNWPRGKAARLATAVPTFAVSAVGSEFDWRYQTA